METKRSMIESTNWSIKYGHRTSVLTNDQQSALVLSIENFIYSDTVVHVTDFY